jgi:hypothetical protein
MEKRLGSDNWKEILNKKNKKKIVKTETKIETIITDEIKILISHVIKNNNWADMHEFEIKYNINLMDFIKFDKIKLDKIKIKN